MSFSEKITLIIYSVFTTTSQDNEGAAPNLDNKKNPAIDVLVQNTKNYHINIYTFFPDKMLN